METNNIFAESYDDIIIDDSLDNEIDLLSSDDASTMDYDEIQDYTTISDDNRATTLERFCEEFRQKLLAALETSSDKPILYFIDKYGNETDIQEISNLLYFAIWDDDYITTNNLPYDVVNNRLMSFKAIEQFLKFKINLFEYLPSPIYPNREDTFQTQAHVRPIIVNTEISINTNKIVSIRDFENFVELTNYFIVTQCDIDYACVDESECILDCVQIEYEDDIW